MPIDAIDVVSSEAVAGESAKARAQLASLIKNIDKQTFDVAELLFDVQVKGLYQPAFNTYKEFTRSLKIKDRKAEYLPKIVKVMKQVGIERPKYEPLGIARLREITSLDPAETYVNPVTKAETPMSVFISEFVEKGDEIEMETLKTHVRTLKGFVGENDFEWLNFYVKRSAATNTIRPALEKIKAIIGSAGKDEDGISKDPSDGAALESAMAVILTDETLGVEKLKEDTGEAS